MKRFIDYLTEVRKDSKPNLVDLYNFWRNKIPQFKILPDPVSGDMPKIESFDCIDRSKIYLKYKSQGKSTGVTKVYFTRRGSYLLYPGQIYIDPTAPTRSQAVTDTTLIHEMIHALVAIESKATYPHYQSHGKEFTTHMNSINEYLKKNNPRDYEVNVTEIDTWTDEDKSKEKQSGKEKNFVVAYINNKPYAYASVSDKILKIYIDDVYKPNGKIVNYIGVRNVDKLILYKTRNLVVSTLKTSSKGITWYQYSDAIAKIHETLKPFKEYEVELK